MFRQELKINRNPHIVASFNSLVRNESAKENLRTRYTEAAAYLPADGEKRKNKNSTKLYLVETKYTSKRALYSSGYEKTKRLQALQIHSKEKKSCVCSGRIDF